MERLEYFLRRMLLIPPTLLGITLLCFGLIQFVPGGPVEQKLMQMRGMGSGESAPLAVGAVSAVSDQQRADLIHHFEFDQPFALRYWHWLIRDRMGLGMESYHFTNKTAWQLIRERLPVSLIFGVTGFVLSYLICIPLGIAKAVRSGGVFDAASSLLVFTGYALPVFACGMVLKMLFSGAVDAFWDWLPLGGFVSDQYDHLSPLGKAWDIARHMALPVACYVVGNFAVLTILMKNSLLEQIGRDYVRTVLAKGGSLRRAIWGHAVRNALMPIATGIGGLMTVMFAGSVIVEQVFEIPGMGRLSLEAIVGRDYPVFMAMLALTSVLGLLGHVLSDLACVIVDPRISFQRNAR